MKNRYTEIDSMMAMSVLITYVVFSYVCIYWIKMFSQDRILSRLNFQINLWVYLLPVLVIISMIVLTGQSLNTIGLKKHIRPWITICISIFLFFQMILGNAPLGLQVVLVFMSEEIIFRGYAAERLQASYGYFGSVLFSGVILGITYSLIPIVNNGITGLELLMYISLGLVTQLILQFFYRQYNNILLPIILHTGIYTLII